jgi:bacteriocin biosynthesis cyclodehydratase domain-containing protein
MAAAGLEAFADGDALILASPAGMLRLDGGVAIAVQQRILPAVEGPVDRDELVRGLADLPAAEVQRLVDRLVEAGMLVESDGSNDWLSLLSTDAATRQALAGRLAAVRLLVLGDRPSTDGLVAMLRAAGVGTLDVLEPDSLSRDALPELVTGRDLVVCTVDPGWTAARAWLNRACLDARVPALYVSVEGSFAYVGPLVLPGEGPCYLCWRMRALACADDFDLAMAREEALDGRRAPLRRPVLPGLVEAVHGLVGREVLALTTSALQPELAGHVVVLDQSKGTRQAHPVVPRPDCPACRKKALPPASEPKPAAEPQVTDFDAIEARVVSEVCGLIRYLDPVPKPVQEPAQPVIVRAQLANVLYGQGEDAFVTCSGKGLDVTTARNTAIGEALERYASLAWTPPRRVTGTRASLPGVSLDPHELVLFAAEDAERLHHARYHDDLVLDWVPARSLVSGAEVWVPHQAVTLHGTQWPRHDLLFAPTSSGFAAGPNVAFAAERALLEVIERDAFMIAWAHRLATEPLDARTVPDADCAAVAELYARRGVTIEVHLLPTDSTAFVAMAVGWSDAEPAVVVGLGADQNAVRAARSAVLEVAQVRPALRSRLLDPDVLARRAELVADPGQVHELDDHDLLYSDAGAARTGLAHLRSRPAFPWRSPAPRGHGLADLVDSLASVAGDALVVDVTPDDVADLGVRVVRGIVPGFQPIHFGADQARLGHQRLFTAPHRWGLRDRAATRADLNPDPHPLA